MPADPSLCEHANIGRSVRVETISIPELQIEQLVLRVRAYCRDCKEAFVPKTMAGGFSTEEIGVIGDEVFVPLAYPQADEIEASDEAPRRPERATAANARPPKEFLH